MYLEHFGLNEMPFSLTPDTSFFMGRAGYQEALNVLLVALRSGEGFVKLTGEVGTGKTLLCRTLLKTLQGEFATAYLPNPYLKPSSLLLSIADELGIAYPKRCTQHQMMRVLNSALLELNASGRRVLVCMDEAQAIPRETLETLRLLTNLETEKAKLLQVVLFGQPELDRVLAQPSIRQLRQRITFSYELKPLDAAGVEEYLAHRLSVAGYPEYPLFTRRAVKSVFEASGGIPRLVNILAHKALMSAFGSGALLVDRPQVREAIRDTDDARRGLEERRAAGARFKRWMLSGLGLGGLFGLAVIAQLLHSGVAG